MSKTKSLLLIAVGYALSVVGIIIAVGVNELRMPADIAQTSPGMVAFGDMILFVLVVGFLGLAPTWFLLKLLVEKAPRTLLATELLAAAMGPVSWLAMVAMAVTTPPGGPSSLRDLPQAAKELFGLFIAFGAIPRIVFGPVLLVIEAVTFFLVRGRVARTLLAGAMLMDLVPLGMYALHMARAIRY
ncbi:MAG: hypothetical protein ACREB2_11715 [Pseudolabrys sp.]